MIAALVVAGILAATLLVAVGVIVWLVHSNNGRVDHVLEAMNERNNMMVKAERSEYEAKLANTALNDERKRTAALEEFISHDAFETDPAAALAPDDVAGRVLRFSRRVSGKATAPASGLPARSDALMRPDEG